MIKLLRVLNYLRGPQVHTVVEVSEEEEVGELVGQVKLAQFFLLEAAHALQDVVVVLVTSGGEGVRGVV